MKKQYFINAKIIDPHNSLNERGGLIIGENGLIEAIRSVKKLGHFFQFCGLLRISEL